MSVPRKGWRLRALGWALGLTALLGACNFDAAFSRYCQNNPHCNPDAGFGPEVKPAPPPDLGPSAGPDLAPDLAPDLGPDAPFGPPPGRQDAGGVPPLWVPRSCNSPGDCIVPIETCHPSSRICIPTCQSSADCPSQFDCIEVPGAPGDPNPPARICACSGTLACSQFSPSFRCNRFDNLCEPPCNSTVDCSMYWPARMCNPYYNNCVECVISADCNNRSDGRSECDFTGRCIRPAS